MPKIAEVADFSSIRYAQCWEDADVLLKALDIRPGACCLSIASAGDNSLAMLARNPARVVAIDLNLAQLACLDLRVAAFRVLLHGEMLELVGSVPSVRRLDLYRRCRPCLPNESRRFWDGRPELIEGGIGTAGKFERYFSIFRRSVLPLVHSRRTVEALFESRTPDGRQAFYARAWNTWRWRLLFRIFFFSRFIMGRMGRDPAFFKYVEGPVATRIAERTRYALTVLDPSQNPYLEWILTGRHSRSLPFALRPENFESIRSNLDRLERRCQSIEEFLEEAGPDSFDAFNLSDIFEYMPPEEYSRLLGRLLEASRPGARLAYWNMLAPRSRPESLADRLVPKTELALRLAAEDKAFFYSAFVVEEVR